MRELPIQARMLATYPDEVIRQAIKDRGMPPALFDQIKYNGGLPAAITALLNWQQRYHDHIPGAECCCP